MWREVRNRKYAAKVAAKFDGRTADAVSEERAKRAKALVTNGKTDFGDGQVVAGEKLLGAVDALPGQEIVRRLPKGSDEHAVIVERREARLLRG